MNPFKCFCDIIVVYFILEEKLISICVLLIPLIKSSSQDKTLKIVLDGSTIEPG